MSQSPTLRRGVSVQQDAERAVSEFYDAVVQPGIALVVFHCSADYDLPKLAACLKERFGDVPVMGCTTAGEITPKGYISGSLTGFSLAGPDFEARTLAVALEPFDSTATGAAVQAMLEALNGGASSRPDVARTFGFMLIDGLSMLEEHVVSTVHQHLSGIDLVGGSAADDVRFDATYLYFDGKFHRNLALLALVKTAVPFTAFRTQHFTKSEKRMVVTRADPNKRQVFEINGLPAAREFARLVGLEIAELTPLIFATHPVVVRIGGQYFVRSIAKVNPDESLTFFCAIDEGIVLTIAQGVDMVENLEQAFESVQRAIGPPSLVLGCDCILRRLETEREGIKERVGKIFAANNVIGFATYGEQINSMHVNQTFTGIALGQRG